MHSGPDIGKYGRKPDVDDRMIEDRFRQAPRSFHEAMALGMMRSGGADKSDVTGACSRLNGRYWVHGEGMCDLIDEKAKRKREAILVDVYRSVRIAGLQ